MPVIGMSLRSMTANREKDSFEGELKINSTPSIGDVKEMNFPSLDKKGVSISFDFVVSYEPQVAKIKISGDMLYSPKGNENIMKQWKSEKKLPDSIAMEVIDSIFRKCIIKSAVMAEDIQLPAPIPMPRARPAEKK